jgi:hypothetical protein
LASENSRTFTREKTSNRRRSFPLIEIVSMIHLLLEVIMGTFLMAHYTRSIALDARFAERTSEFITTTCRLNPGVDSRASNPNATR